MVDLILFSTFYTILIAIVAAIHYFKGRREGMQEVLIVVAKLEPEVFKNLKPKIERLINEREASS